MLLRLTQLATGLGKAVLAVFAALVDGLQGAASLALVFDKPALLQSLRQTQRAHVLLILRRLAGNILQASFSMHQLLAQRFDLITAVLQIGLVPQLDLLGGVVQGPLCGLELPCHVSQLCLNDRNALGPELGLRLGKVATQVMLFQPELLQRLLRALDAGGEFGQALQVLDLGAGIAQTVMNGHQISKFVDHLARVLTHGAGFQHQFADQASQVINLFQTQRP